MAQHYGKTYKPNTRETVRRQTGGAMFQEEKHGHQKVLHINGLSVRTLESLQARILGIAEERGLINWSYGVVDGSFSLWERWR
jgi:hypothetical protein